MNNFKKTTRSPKNLRLQNGSRAEPLSLWGAVCRWQTFSADRAGRRDRGNRTPRVFPLLLRQNQRKAEQPKNYDNLFLI